MTAGLPLHSNVPAVVAKQLGLDMHGANGLVRTYMLTWDALLDLAVDAYWKNRVRSRDAA